MTTRPFILNDDGSCTGPDTSTMPDVGRERDRVRLVNALNDAYEAGAKSTATDALERRLRIAEAQVTAARLWWEKSVGVGELPEWMDKAKADAEKEMT